MLRAIIVAFLLGLMSTHALAAGLKVGISPDYPPLAMKQEADIVGIEADNARALEALLGQKITLVEMSFAELMPALLTGEVDALDACEVVADARDAARTAPEQQLGDRLGPA